jgi:two-component sensor histidine kinase
MMLNKPRVDPTRPARSLTDAVELIVIAIVYVVVAKASLALASINPSASPIWPPTGLALACTLLWGYRVWPAILLAAFIVNATTAGSLSTSLAIAIGNTCESVVGAILVNRWSDGIGTFDTPAGVGRFAAICLFPSTAISATLGVLSLSLAGFADWANFVPIWLTWWMGDLAGALLIAPVIVLWVKSPPRTLQWPMLARSGMVFAAAAVIGLVAFSPLAKQVAFSSALAFLCIVPLMWAALRHDQRDTATTALILACFAVWGVISGGGPFMHSNINDRFLLLLAFMISISVPSVALSANMATHDRHQQHIETVMLELTHRSKNLLAVIQSIARQVARRTKNFEDFDHAFSARIRALADAHDLLVMRNWQGAPIREIIHTQLTPFGQADARRLTIDGPDLMLKPKAVEHLGLALHELATNATKYGALSVPGGFIKVHWTMETDGRQSQRIRIDWKESGGPPVLAPDYKGFGHMVITHLVPKGLEGHAELNYSAAGLSWTLTVPAANVIEPALRHA